MTRLAALFVNHRSGAWTLRAVESLMLEWGRDGRALRDLEVVVADSGSGEAEGTWLRSLRRLGAHVVTCKDNVGYAGGLNRAYELTHGVPDDVVALCNPDLWFLPGSVRPLLERLARAPEVALVAPRCYVDEARALHLPPNAPPSPAEELAELLAARFPALGRRRAARRSALARAWWGSESPVRAEMLSGACLFLRRGTVDALGGPMDADYPLYFEDADLCARLRARGERLELVPASEVLHHWSRAAGPRFEGEPARRWHVSRARYHAQHHAGALDRARRRLVTWLGFERPPLPLHPARDLGACGEAPTFELARDGRWQLELSLTPHFGLAAGARFEGATYALPARTWSWLFPAVYHARVVDADSGAFAGAWRFEKTSPARSWPLDPGSLPQPRAMARPRDGRGERVG